MSSAGPHRSLLRFALDSCVCAISALGTVGYAAGRGLRRGVLYAGGLAYLFGDSMAWIARGLFTRQYRFSWSSLAKQMVRVGVRSIPMIALVSTCIGVILALQMAPALKAIGSLERVAHIIAIAMFRELGPLVAAILLSGFAGASIAAEIGTMVETEEVKALRAHALDPVRYLVVPRFLATTAMLIGLAVLADVVGVACGMITSWLVFDLQPASYIESTRLALVRRDFITGLIKAGVLGVLISTIACYEGLNVRGGAEGVGRATTGTVVKSIVALIATDCVFTAVFYLFGL